MSKSYSQKPDFLPETEIYIKGYFKHYANKRVRKCLNIDNGSQYKKLCDPHLAKEQQAKLKAERLVHASFIQHNETEDLLKSS